MDVVAVVDAVTAVDFVTAVCFVVVGIGIAAVEGKIGVVATSTH